MNDNCLYWNEFIHKFTVLKDLIKLEYIKMLIDGFENITPNDHTYIYVFVN